MDLLEKLYNAKDSFDACIGNREHIQTELVSLLINVAHLKGVMDIEYMQTLENYSFIDDDVLLEKYLDSEQGNDAKFLCAFLTFIVRKDRFCNGLGFYLVELIENGVVSKLIEKMMTAFPIEKQSTQ